MLKKILVISFGLILCASAFTPFCLAEDKIIAIVNSDIITQKDLNDFINFMRVQLSAEYKGKELESQIQSMKLNLLEKLVEDRLILQEAKKLKINIDRPRIEARKNEIRKRYGSEEQFQKILTQQGVTEADLDKKISDQIMMFAVIDYRVKDKISITPTEITEFYDKHKSEFLNPGQREFESLVTDDELAAKDIVAMVKNNTSMGEAAKKYSLDIHKISFVKGKEFREDIEDILTKLKENEVSAPIKIEDKFYIFKLYTTIAPRQQALSEAQDPIRNYIFETKMQEQMSTWLDEIKKNAYIKFLQN